MPTKSCTFIFNDMHDGTNMLVYVAPMEVVLKFYVGVVDMSMHHPCLFWFHTHVVAITITTQTQKVLLLCDIYKV